MRVSDEERLGNWRTRRLLACTLVADLRTVIEHLGTDDGSELPPSDSAAAPITDDMRRELSNAATVLLRQVLLFNDGRVSPAVMRKF